MKRAGRDSVGVGDVSPGYGTQAHEIKIGVLCNQRIECPLDQGNPARQGVGALKEFQLAAYAAVSMRVLHCRHVGVQERLVIAPSCDGHREANQIVSVESTENLPSRFGGNHEQRDRNNVNVGGLPDFTLQADTSFKFFYPMAIPERDATLRHSARGCGAERFLPAAGLHHSVSWWAAERSLFLAASHRTSSSSLESWARRWPDLAASASIFRKRNLNFRLECLSATSGSNP